MIKYETLFLIGGSFVFIVPALHKNNINKKLLPKVNLYVSAFKT